MTSDSRTESFLRLRPRLFSVAYRMLGSATEAEDVVQDAYLRYQSAEESPRAEREFLVTIVSRLALDKLKSAQRTRETYIGQWLPEPVLTPFASETPFGEVERREALTLGFLSLLERLSPPERAVFVLREAFDYDYSDLARILGLSPSNCRQLLHRARERMATAQRRFHADEQQERRLLEHFLRAAQYGDVDGLAAVLAQDVAFFADGGGKATSISRPVVGREAVARLLAGFGRQSQDVEGLSFELASINFEPALVALIGEDLAATYVFELGEKGIVNIHATRNPDKLAYLRGQLGL